MPSKWVGRTHKGHVGIRSRQREKGHRADPKDKSCNTCKCDYDMWWHAKFSTESTKEYGPSSV